MSLDDQLENAEDQLAGLKLSREKLDAVNEAGAKEAEAETAKIRAGTQAQKVIARLAEAFARGATRAALGGA